jgi:hypothetical protein
MYTAKAIQHSYNKLFTYRSVQKFSTWISTQYLQTWKCVSLKMDKLIEYSDIKIVRQLPLYKPPNKRSQNYIYTK